MLSLPLLFQYWLKQAKKIWCPAPLPEEPVTSRLGKMLEPAPYKAPEKKATGKAKGVRSGPRHKGTLDATSEDKAPFPAAKDDVDEEEEESDCPLMGGGRKKRAASTTLEAEAPKKGKGSLAGNSAWDVDDSSEGCPRAKPRAAS